MQQQQTDHETSPLVTNGLLFKLTAFIGALAALTAILTVAASYYGDRLAMDGHTESREAYRIGIGQDALLLPANMIRFETQRRSGPAEIVNIYLSWPDMDGYSAAEARRFSDPAGAKDLIFVEFSQSVMSRDMSGRLQPIYSRLFRGEAAKGPAGLLIHQLDPRSSFGQEVVLTGMKKNGSTYVARCLLPKTPAAASTADCQRDLHVGRDLTLLYRFSSTLLPDWEALDDRIQAFADGHIQK